MMFYGIIDYATSYATLLVHNERRKSQFSNELTDVGLKQTSKNMGPLCQQKSINKLFGLIYHDPSVMGKQRSVDDLLLSSLRSSLYADMY